MVHPPRLRPVPRGGGYGDSADLGGHTFIGDNMFNHLFDIDDKSTVDFERIDFGVQEVRFDGEVVWWRRYGQRDLEI